ncbi:glycosyltransferase family 2 protein [Methanospirillum sp. J.3.6.1-F.2.7.3]|uniref:Glycosyltransferase family 2 protein n=1 Tax=Methanospirillum purgamenti TaxID=2834276 RepID=A0A8E7AZH2_9EURY|nr:MULTISPECIES: glycosyltransferase family 2 protein [Methanospirillum]MDX8551884.1 glycosyltransferase family 2 protein [Methanospirillum hungatei]QVV89164.1 glycosyltransferase family 2 protein [Methanospirillum sp. J.3.6.1-F.2.7.3]
MDTNKPLVSVGIPTFNRPQQLKRTIECIIGQTYKKIEIIISDNCSPDHEVTEIVNNYLILDSRIRFIKQPENKGASFNASFVLKESSGEYFMWAADDDEWYPDYIEKCMEILLSDRSIRLCSTEIIVVSDLIQHDETLWISGESTSNNSILTPYWLIREDLLTFGLKRIKRVKKYILNAGTDTCFYGIFHLQTLRDIFFNSSFQSDKYGADRFLIARFQLLYPVYRIQMPLFIYHHGFGVSSGNALNMNNKFSNWQYYGLRINPLLTAYLNMIIDSLSWQVSITDHIRVIGYYLARMAKAKIMRYTMKTPFFGTPLYDYKPPEYPKRE